MSGSKTIAKAEIRKLKPCRIISISGEGIFGIMWRKVIFTYSII
jgi:hypothetical protein